MTTRSCSARLLPSFLAAAACKDGDSCMFVPLDALAFMMDML